MAAIKSTRLLARRLFKLSFVDGKLSESRVRDILAALEQNPPHHYLAVLTAYHSRVQRELAASAAVVEHAGAVSGDVLGAIERAMSTRYGRSIKASAKPAPELLAGLRVRVGDDVYESSVAGQLAALSGSV